MIRLKLIVVVLIGSWGISCYGQSYIDATGAGRINSSRVLNEFSSLRNKNSRFNVPLEEIKGSMYYEEAFKEGTIVREGSAIISGQFLRHNAFSDEIEIKTNQNIASEDFVVLNKEEKISVEIGSISYLYRSFFPSKNKTQKGYLIPLVMGSPYRLYQQKIKEYREEQKASPGLGASIPARFEEKHILYYQFHNGEIERLKQNNKTLNIMLKKSNIKRDELIKIINLDLKNTTEWVDILLTINKLCK